MLELEPREVDVVRSMTVFPCSFIVELSTNGKAQPGATNSIVNGSVKRALTRKSGSQQKQPPCRKASIALSDRLASASRSQTLSAALAFGNMDGFGCNALANRSGYAAQVERRVYWQHGVCLLRYEQTARLRRAGPAVARPWPVKRRMAVCAMHRGRSDRFATRSSNCPKGMFSEENRPRRLLPRTRWPAESTLGPTLLPLHRVRKQHDTDRPWEARSQWPWLRGRMPLSESASLELPAA